MIALKILFILAAIPIVLGGSIVLAIIVSIPFRFMLDLLSYSFNWQKLLDGEHKTQLRLLHYKMHKSKIAGNKQDSKTPKTAPKLRLVK